MRRVSAALASALVLVACGAPSTAPVDPDAGTRPAELDAASPGPADASVAVRDAAGPRVDAGADAALDAGAPLGAPYPIVLAHGFFGFEDFAGAGFVDYFWRVRQALADDGEALVFTPAVDPFNDSTVRGHQLLEHIERILRETGHDRVNIVAHSQGGLDARVVAHVRPDLVASVTTIATPHRGTPIADIVLGLVADDRTRDLADALARAIAAPLYDADGEETSVFTSLRQLSTQGVEELERTYWDDRTVPFFSIGGRSDRHSGGSACEAEDAPEFVQRWWLARDPIDALLSLSESMIDGGFGGPDANDGLVRAQDSHIGRFLGCIPADHFDEIGQLLGDGGGFANPFDHRAFYVELVRWLRAQGY